MDRTVATYRWQTRQEKRILVPFLFLLGLCPILFGGTAGPTKEGVYFGIVESEKEGNPFVGVYKSGKFIDQKPDWSDSVDLQTARRRAEKYYKQIRALTEHFPLKRPLPGLTQKGQSAKVVIDNVSQPRGDTSETLFEVRTEPSRRSKGNEVALFWTPDIHLRHLPPVTAQLDPEAEREMQKAALEL